MAGFEVASVEPPPGAGQSTDAVIDLEITANRPDCLSVIGIGARGVHALPDGRSRLRQSKTLARPTRRARPDCA